MNMKMPTLYVVVCEHNCVRIYRLAIVHLDSIKAFYWGSCFEFLNKFSPNLSFLFIYWYQLFFSSFLFWLNIDDYKQTQQPSCFLLSQGAIIGPIVSYAVMLWIGIGQYSVIGVPENFRFPTDTCQIGNSSLSMTNLTTVAASTTFINSTISPTTAPVPIEDL